MNEPQRVSLLGLTCRQASELASAALDRELTRRERWALRLHTLLCGACRKWQRQVAAIRAALDVMPEDWRRQWRDPQAKLSPERREKIKRLLRQAESQS